VSTSQDTRSSEHPCESAAAGDGARIDPIAQRRHRWLNASQEIARASLAEQSSPLPLITRHARQVGGAGVATIMLPIVEAPDALFIAAAAGAPTSLLGEVVPRGGTLAGRALADDADLAVEDAVAAGQVLPIPHVPLGPTLVVRLPATREGLPGVLTLSRDIGAAAFDREEQDMTAGFAAQASMALELARAREIQRRQLLADDRERIARELNDEAVQRLFALGLSLTGTASYTNDPSTRARLESAPEELDEVICAIREIVFQLYTAKALDV
jgi:signal transduction histidine kinase